MNNNRGFGFIGGFLLGGVVGAAGALLLAPYSGEETRGQIRYEGVALKNRGKEFGDDRVHQVQKLVQQGQREIADVQARLGGAIDDQKDNLQDALDAGKNAASHRKDEMVSRFEGAKPNVKN